MDKPGQNMAADEQPAAPRVKPKAKFAAREAAAKVGIGKSQSIFTLVVVSITASVLIAFYVLVVGLFMLHKKHEDIVSDAAIEAARELSDVTVDNQSTGPLNLCRWRKQGTFFFNSSTDNTRTIVSVKRTYSKIEQVAKITAVDTFRNLLSKDQKVLNQLEHDLRDRLDTAIAHPATVKHIDEKLTQGKIYRTLANMIASRYGLIDRTALNLHIQLGYRKDQPAPGNGQLFLISPDSFIEAAPGQTPNMVLLSYTEPSKRDNSTNSMPKETSACVYINPATESPIPAAFVLSFPQGTPPFAIRLMDYIKGKDWKAKGSWYQAMYGEMPGSGHLAPPIEPLLPQMSPAEALATEIYHWLKYAGDRIEPELVASMLNEAWTPESAQFEPDREDEHSFGMLDDQVNSCVVNDTGSREHALMFESKQGEAGQAGLARAFLLNDYFSESFGDSRRSSTSSKPTIPDNAFPLCVDSTGRASIAGQTGYDEKLIRDFFTDLQTTNLAARETLATIKPMQQMSVQLISQLEQKLRVEREDLNSLILRANRLGAGAARNSADSADSAADSGSESTESSKAKKANQKLKMQRQITNDKIEDLKLMIESDTNQLANTKESQRLCAIAKYNASRAELNTYDLNAQKLRYCRDGLIRVTDQGYLLGKNLAFKPIAKALPESDFEQSVSASNTSSPSIGSGTGGGIDTTAKKSAWLSNNLILIGSPDEVFPDLSKTYSGKWKSLFPKSAGPTRFAPQMLVIDSRSILSDHKPGTKFIESFSKYPFNNIAVPQSEVIYYCETAITTGDKPKVGWSVLARDFLANRGPVGNSSTSTFVGLPIAASNSSWCHGQAFNGSACPRLACEFQVRTPLPLIGNAFEDAFLQNAHNGERTPLIPVVTPDML